MGSADFGHRLAGGREPGALGRDAAYSSGGDAEDAPTAKGVPYQAVVGSRNETGGPSREPDALARSHRSQRQRSQRARRFQTIFLRPLPDRYPPPDRDRI